MRLDWRERFRNIKSY